MPETNLTEEEQKEEKQAEPTEQFRNLIKKGPFSEEKANKLLRAGLDINHRFNTQIGWMSKQQTFLSIAIDVKNSHAIDFILKQPNLNTDRVFVMSAGWNGTTIRTALEHFLEENKPARSQRPSQDEALTALKTLLGTEDENDENFKNLFVKMLQKSKRIVTSDSAPVPLIVLEDYVAHLHDAFDQAQSLADLEQILDGQLTDTQIHRLKEDVTANFLNTRVKYCEKTRAFKYLQPGTQTHQAGMFTIEQHTTNTKVANHSKQYAALRQAAKNVQESVTNLTELSLPLTCFLNNIKRKAPGEPIENEDTSALSLEDRMLEFAVRRCASENLKDFWQLLKERFQLSRDDLRELQTKVNDKRPEMGPKLYDNVDPKGSTGPFSDVKILTHF